jgi:hypothetical protein
LEKKCALFFAQKNTQLRTMTAAVEPAVMYLVKSTGRVSHHRFRLTDDVYTFGSADTCDIIIRRAGVAPEHARVVQVAPGHYELECAWLSAASPSAAQPDALELKLQRGTHKWSVRSRERLQHRDLITIAKRRFFFTGALPKTALLFARPHPLPSPVVNTNAGAASQSLDPGFSQMSTDLPAPVPVPAPVVVHREVPAVQAQPSPKRRRSFTPIPDVAELIVVADETKPPTIPQLSVTSSDFIERAVPVVRLPARVSPVAPLAVAASTSRSPARPTAAPVVSTSALGNAVRTYESRQKPTAPTVAKSPSPSLPTPQKVSAVSSAGRRAVAQRNDVVVSDDKDDYDEDDDNDDSGGDVDAPPVGKSKPAAKRLSKGSGTKGPLSKHRVLLSHAASSRWINKLKDLGAEVLNSETIESLTVRAGDVFVACVKRTPDLQPKASFKLLLALALRAPIVTYEWIDACVEQQKCLGVEPYLLSLRHVIDADAPERRDDLPSMDGRRIELIGGTESVRKQMSFILERLGVQVIKGDSRVLGQYKLTAAISFGDGARATQRAQEMRAHKYAVVGIKWLKYCLCAGGYVDPLSSESFAAADVEPMPTKSRYVYDDAEIDEDEVPRTRSSKRKAAAAVAEEDDNNKKNKKKKKDEDEEEEEHEEEEEEVEEEDDDDDDSRFLLCV